MFILSIVLIVALMGSLPTWLHSKNWGQHPIGDMSVGLLIVLTLALAGLLRGNNRRNVLRKLE